MRNTREAIKYGIETLRVSPERMFALIESSDGYDGDDYQRWLANEIIKIAEKDGVGYSQLLVKKFSIIQSLIEEYSDDSISPMFVDFFSKKLKAQEDKVFSIGYDWVGTELQDIDWFNGIDYDEVNSGFVYKKLPEEVKESLLGDGVTTFFSKLSGEPADKNSDLFKDAKSRSIVCKNEGSLMLYRMCSLVSAFESYTQDNFRFAFLTSTNFLYNKDNESIINYFLSYFTYGGIIVNSSDLFVDSYSSGEYAFVICRPRTAKDAVKDGFVLKDIKVDNGKMVQTSVRRFSRSSNSMLQYLIDSAVRCTDEVYMESPDGKVTIKGLGFNEALGYLNYDKALNVCLSSLPIKGMHYIPITEVNLHDVIVYYAVSKSVSSFGMSGNIKEIVNGNAGYKELLYNCLPLFLFDTDSKFCDHGALRVNGEIVRLPNHFDIESSDIVASMLDQGGVYFSFESKELLNICKGFLDFLNKDFSMVGKTFAEVRAEANHEELNKSYMIALNNIKDYISTLYRKVE